MATERWELIILGRAIGTCTGWDQVNVSKVQFVGFRPYQGIALPLGNICVDFDGGTVVPYGDDGTAAPAVDMVRLLQDIPRKVPLNEPGTSS